MMNKGINVIDYQMNEIRYLIAQECMSDDLGGNPGDYDPDDTLIDSDNVNEILIGLVKEWLEKEYAIWIGSVS